MYICKLLENRILSDYNLYNMKILLRYKLPFARSLVGVLILSLFLLQTSKLQAQTPWTLDSCISYAYEHSFEVQQKLLSIQYKEIAAKQTKMRLAPQLSGSVGQNFDIGRSQDASSLISSGSQAATSIGLGLSMPLFEGLRNYHQMQADEIDIRTSLYELEQLRENIELNVMAYYLQILNRKEMLQIAQLKETISQEMVQKVTLLVQNGKSSETELYNARSTYAQDRTAVIQAENNLKLAKLELAQLINVPNPDLFEIDEVGEISDIDQFLNHEMPYIDIASVIQNATTNRGTVKAAQSRIEKSQKEIKIAQSGWYPSLSLYANYGTGYYYSYAQNPVFPNAPFFNQLEDNSRQVIGLSLNIPIFDRLSTYHQTKIAKLQLQDQQLQYDENIRKLTKEIQQAYAEMIAAEANYKAAKEFYEASKISFEYEKVRFDAGASTQFEFNEIKNRYNQAHAQWVQAKYDYLFKYRIVQLYGN